MSESTSHQTNARAIRWRADGLIFHAETFLKPLSENHIRLKQHMSCGHFVAPKHVLRPQNMSCDERTVVCSAAPAPSFRSTDHWPSGTSHPRQASEIFAKLFLSEQNFCFLLTKAQRGGRMGGWVEYRAAVRTNVASSGRVNARTYGRAVG